MTAMLQVACTREGIEPVALNVVTLQLCVCRIAVVMVWSGLGAYSVHISVLICSLLYHMSSCFWRVSDVDPA
jgi:hypothetical protein